MKTKLIIAAVAVAAAVGVWFFYFRRRVAAEVSGASLYQNPPSPQAVIAQLTAPIVSAVQQKIEGVTYRALGTVGDAIVPNLPQSTPTPRTSARCPSGYVGYHPDEPTLYCAGSVAPGSKTSNLLAQIRANLGMT